MRNSHKPNFERKPCARSSKGVARLKPISGSNLLKQNCKRSISVATARPETLNYSSNCAKLKENGEKQRARHNKVWLRNIAEISLGHRRRSARSKQGDCIETDVTERPCK